MCTNCDDYRGIKVKQLERVVALESGGAVAGATAWPVLHGYNWQCNGGWWGLV